MIEVVTPGLLTTVQDAGLRGGRALGLPVTGALDGVSYRVANILVGNPPGAAALEVTLRGPTLRFHADALVALCGPQAEVTLDGEPVPTHAPVLVDAGRVLRVGGLAGGARAYLAVRGGLRAWRVLGSASTNLRAAFGGHEGRALKVGDELHVAETLPLPGRVPRIRAAREYVVRVGSVTMLPALPGPDGSPNALVRASWRVSPASDRMGLRLTGEVVDTRPADRSSEPVVPGVVQLPPDGQPIVLLADAGTHGGYARPLVVTRAALPALGQLRPGDRVGFHLTTHHEATLAVARQERALRALRLAVQYAYAASAP